MSAVSSLDPPRLLAEAVDVARAAAVEEAAAEYEPAGAGAAVGEHLEARLEGVNSLTHFFAAELPGYRGWRWSVSLACAGDDEPVTVSEVVLVPGAEALVAPPWVPWQQRVRPGDLGPGDLLPVDADDPRLVPAYVQSDDPAVEEVALEIGLGRTRVLSRQGRLEAAERWRRAHGPSAEQARSAPGSCGTCAFLVPLGGSLRAGFGVCANEFAPVDGIAVAVEFGCGAHSEAEVELGSPVHVAELVYDDGLIEPVPVGSATAESVTAEAEQPGVTS